MAVAFVCRHRVEILGAFVFSRITVVAALAALASGCAGESSPSAQLLSTASMQTPAGERRPTVAQPSRDQSARANMPRKTIADRVLTAIALERVTGLKPDPSRLIQ